MAERISKEKIKDEVTKITSLTEQIKIVVESMPVCSAQKAYMNSIVNLEKKNETFSKEREKLSDEEKEIMKQALITFRAKKENEVSSVETKGTDEPIPEISESAMGKKKGRKN